MRLSFVPPIVLLVPAVLALGPTLPIQARASEPVTIEYWHINSPTFGGSLALNRP